MSKYPNEFLGRCQTCLDNAMLSSAPCRIGYGNGMPLRDDDCMIRRERKRHDAAAAGNREGAGNG